MSKFKGVIPALITPFKNNGQLFIRGIRNEIEHLHSFGYKRIFAGGSYSSFPLMNVAERIEFNTEVAKVCRELEIESIIHIGTTNIKDSIEIAIHAEIDGADVLSSVVPYYYSSTFYDEDIVLRYYEELANSINIDLHCYNNEKATGFKISNNLFKKIIDVGVRGIKDGNSSTERILTMLEICDDSKYDIEYYPSSTSSLINGFLLGCDSCISGLALSFPVLVLDIYDFIMIKDIDIAIESYKKLMKIRSLMNEKTGRAIVAYSLMNLNGVEVGTCRKPWIELSKKEAKELNKKIMEILK